MFEKWRYSVCCKSMTFGEYRCGRDSTIFEAFSYEFDKADEVAEYLQMFEDGKLWVSERCYTLIYKIEIKECE